MSAALTKGQKSYLAQLAQRAWRRECAVVRGEGREVAEMSAKAAEAWRHRVVIEACGKAGLRCCSQDDYGLVKGALLERLGEHGKAFEAQVRQATNGKRVGHVVLRRELEAAELREEYASAICRRQYRRGLDEASEKQIWGLIFTVRNRAAKRRRDGVTRRRGDAEGAEDGTQPQMANAIRAEDAAW